MQEAGALQKPAAQLGVTHRDTSNTHTQRLLTLKYQKKKHPAVNKVHIHTLTHINTYACRHLLESRDLKTCMSMSLAAGGNTSP